MSVFRCYLTFTSPPLHLFAGIFLTQYQLSDDFNFLIHQTYNFSLHCIYIVFAKPALHLRPVVIRWAKHDFSALCLPHVVVRKTVLELDRFT